MTKRKKPDPKPTPPAADIAVDKSAFLAHADSPVLDDAEVAKALAAAINTPPGPETIARAALDEHAKANTARHKLVADMMSEIASGPILGVDSLGNEHFAAPLAGRQMTIEQDGPVSLQFHACPICGTRRVSFVAEGNVIRWADVCPVDGHRFEAK